ncbi:MAG: hypothetical protein JNN15_21225, partial [Blastocatellia bacterium]|nr:hypothetical protein [Blastocatellia bacterium]
EKLKNNRFDLDAILLRAESAEQLNLSSQAIADYEQYLTISTDIEARARVEDKLNAVRQKQTEIVAVEPTSYERLNKLIDDYLKAFIEGNSVAATDNLETAKAIAILMLKDTGERVGIDTVEYYSKVSIDAAQQLLDTRQEIEEISKIAAVDKFEESIHKLEKAKNIFTQHQAISDIQRTIFLLAKFLIKADKVNTAKNEVNTWLKVAEEKSYLFNKAQLLYQQGQISVIEGVEQLSIQKASESLEICRMLYAGKFLLYPLLLVSQVYSAAGVEEITFIKSTEGVIKSLEYQNPGFFCQFLNRAGVASFGLKTPDLAEAYLRESLRVSQKENLHGYTAVTKSILAALLAEKGNLTEAKFLIEEAKVKDAAKTLDLMARKQQLFRIRAYEGKIYGLAKDFNKSERSYKEAIKIAAEVGYKQIAGFHHYKQGLAEALYEQGKKDEALKEILEAKEMQRKLLLNLQVESKNRLLKVNFSTKEIEELIDLIQR